MDSDTINVREMIELVAVFQDQVESVVNLGKNWSNQHWNKKKVINSSSELG
ncbi:MAG: hypothetical protein ACW98I_18110 [Candidatus Hodarchaeales archaeon]|jgi:hypothetical protein